MPRLLITGFGPFPRVPRNLSERVARAVAANPRWRLLGWQIDLRILDTRYSALEEQLLPALHESEPDAVLLLGVAPRRDAVTPERQARNRVSRLFPDAGGRVGDASLRLDRDDPRLIRRTQAPIAAMVRAMRRRGLRAKVSRDAGRYLCNAAYYQALRALGPARSAQTVFIHIPFPRNPAQLRVGRTAGERRHRRPSERELTIAINDCIYLLMTRMYSP
jgi:pyroglutamyl-peptidase